MPERPGAVGALFCESDIPMQKISNRREMVAIRTTGQSVGAVFFVIRRFALFWGRMNFISLRVYRETLKHGGSEWESNPPSPPKDDDRRF